MFRSGGMLESKMEEDQTGCERISVDWASCCVIEAVRGETESGRVVCHVNVQTNREARQSLEEGAV